MSDQVVGKALREVARNGLQVELLMELLELVKLSPGEFQRARRALNVAGGKAYPGILWACNPARGSGSRRHAWRMVERTQSWKGTRSGEFETACNSQASYTAEEVAEQADLPWTEEDRRCTGCKSNISSGYNDPVFTKTEFRKVVADSAFQRADAPEG